MLCLNGDTVAWVAQKQPVVAAYLHEAEYIAMSDTFNDSLGLYYFLGEFVQVDLPVHAPMDIRGAISIPYDILQTRHLNALTFATV